jgi:hypothetical protein
MVPRSASGGRDPPLALHELMTYHRWAAEGEHDGMEDVNKVKVGE